MQKKPNYENNWFNPHYIYHVLSDEIIDISYHSYTLLYLCNVSSIEIKGLGIKGGIHNIHPAYRST